MHISKGKKNAPMKILNFVMELLPKFNVTLLESIDNILDFLNECFNHFNQFS